MPEPRQNAAEAEAGESPSVWEPAWQEVEGKAPRQELAVPSGWVRQVALSGAPA